VKTSNITIDDDDDFSSATNLVTLQTDNNSDKDNILDNINHKILTEFQNVTIADNVRNIR